MSDSKGAYSSLSAEDDEDRFKLSSGLGDFMASPAGNSVGTADFRSAKESHATDGFDKVASVRSTGSKASAQPLVSTASVTSGGSTKVQKLLTPTGSVKRIVSVSSSITGGQMEYMGHNILRDEGKWQFVLMLPLIPPSKEVDKKWDDIMESDQIQARLRHYFPRFVLQNVDGEFDYLQLSSKFGIEAQDEDDDQDDKAIRDELELRSLSGLLTGEDGSIKTNDEENPASDSIRMTRREFHEAVRETIVMLLAGPHIGMKLQASESVDRDELFLKLELLPGEPVWSSANGRWIPGRSKRYNTLEQLADAMDLRVPLLASAYPHSTPCPTEELDHKRNFAGRAYVPAVVPYTKANRKFYAPFTGLDLMRMARMRVSQFFVLEELMRDEVILPGGFFAVHHWTEIQRFRSPPSAAKDGSTSHPEGWCHWRAMFTYPGDEHCEHVRSYFGEEVAFFFHWLNFFTRFLILPSIVGLVLFCSSILICLPSIGGWFLILEEYLSLAFAVGMVIWSASFGELYKRHVQLPIEKWGMRNYQAMDRELASFKKEKVGSKQDTFLRTVHWLLVGLVLLWTIGFNFAITAWRKRLLQSEHEDEPSLWLAQAGKYLVSINIQLVDLLWSYVSPRITNVENHRTSRDRQEARTTKLFVVKMFVYYWPFWYIAFLQSSVEEMSDAACLQYLQETLAVYLIIHILFQALYTIIPVGQAHWHISKELRETGSEHYTYLQAQAKLPPEKNLDDDFLELIISLGIVMQFSALVPIIPCVQYISNMVELRLLAYQMLEGYRRNPANGMEGIGVWQSIIYLISCMAVIINVGLGVFFQEPMRSQERPQQLLVFIVAEHLLFAAKGLVEIGIPDKNLVTVMVQMTNEAVKHKLFDGRHAGKPVLVKGPRHMPNTSLIVEDRDLPPGMVSPDGTMKAAPVRDRQSTVLKVRSAAGKDSNTCIRSMPDNLTKLLGMS
mmetsp:Transcript_56196/g.131597  ORF Transcript_56196/g.131597 Transcript_56196/m.131597 type:complete len:954 (+) Transcript_56196:73-2934(+)